MDQKTIPSFRGTRLGGVARGGCEGQRLEKPERVAHLFNGGGLVEGDKAREQQANGPHRRHHNPRMAAALGHVTVMERDEVANVL